MHFFVTLIWVLGEEDAVFTDIPVAGTFASRKNIHPGLKIIELCYRLNDGEWRF